MERQTKGKTYKDYIRFKILFLVALVFVAFAAIVLDIAIGSSGMTLWDVIRAIFGFGDKKMNVIVWNMRMPRVATAFVAGLGLAMVGTVLQSALRNPLADASTLGVSQGAAFGAAFAIVVLGSGMQSPSDASISLSNPVMISTCAFISSIFPTIVIIGMSRSRNARPETMILTGVALGALFSGGTAIIQYFADTTQLGSIVFWTLGSLSSTTWREVGIMAVVVAATGVYFYCNRWGYNVLLGGENTAKALGVNTGQLTIISMILCSLTASVITSYIGILNFIGLVAPHLMRKVIGNDYRYLLPASALAGTSVLLLSDTLSRSILSPQVLPIGAITSFIGAPIFLMLIHKGGRRK